MTKKMKKHASAMLMVVFAGLSLNAHALCVNKDGSLDDKSVPTASVAVEMLPTCEGATQRATAQDSMLQKAEVKSAAPAMREIHAKPADTDKGTHS